MINLSNAFGMTFDGALSFCGDLEGQATESQVQSYNKWLSRWLDEFDILNFTIDYTNIDYTNYRIKCTVIQNFLR